MDNSRVQACVLFFLAAVSIGANSAAAQGKTLTARDVIAAFKHMSEFPAEGDGGHVQGGQSGRGGQRHAVTMMPRWMCSSAPRRQDKI